MPGPLSTTADFVWYFKAYQKHEITLAGSLSTTVDVVQSFNEYQKPVAFGFVGIMITAYFRHKLWRPLFGFSIRF